MGTPTPQNVTVTKLRARVWKVVFDLGEILKRHGIDTPSNALVIDLMKWREGGWVRYWDYDFNAVDKSVAEYVTIEEDVGQPDWRARRLYQIVHPL